MNKTRKSPKIPKRVLRLVNPNLHEKLADAVSGRDWSGALLLVSSVMRISLCMDLFLARLVPPEDQPTVLAEAISGGDLPSRERDVLVICLRRFRQEGRRVFDGERAREAFGTLPEVVTVYRGTVEAERPDDYGICWTLDREQAQWFATAPHRGRNFRSPPVILSATVKREHVAGLLLDRNESEVLVDPATLCDVTRESCAVSSAT